MRRSRRRRCAATARCRDAREREQAQALVAQLTAVPVLVTARAGEGGKLFGSVTSADIAVAIESASGVTVDRRKVSLDEPIKALGTSEVEVVLHADVKVTVTVEVVAG